MKSRFLFPILVIFFMAGCQNDSLSIKNHEKPDLQTDFTAFENVGCKSKGSGWYVCDSKSPLHEIGCDSIEKQDLLGGFTPNYPVAKCHHSFYKESGANPTPSECLTSTVRIFGADCDRLVVFKNGSYSIIKNRDDLRNLYAPVDSPNEALSFALASTKNHAEYGQTQKSQYVYYAQELEDTYVETVENGYLVHLFYTPVIGCGPFETVAIEEQVTRDGQVEEINRIPVYRDPADDTLCAD